MFLFQSSGFLLAEGRQCCQLQLRAVTAGSRVRVLGKLCQWQWDEARNFYTSSIYIYIYIHLWEGNWVFYYIIHVHTCIIEYRYMHCQRNKHKLLPVLRLIQLFLVFLKDFYIRIFPVWGFPPLTVVLMTLGSWPPLPSS